MTSVFRGSSPPERRAQVRAAELLRMSYRSFRHYKQKYNIPS
jgi:hypothetical protein